MGCVRHVLVSRAMYTCPECQREFASEKDSKHWCTDTTVDDIFAKSSDEVLLTFDAVLLATADWDPNYIGAAKRAVVCAKRKAWMIIRPYRKWLDLMVFFPEHRREPFVHKIQPRYTGKMLEHIVRLHSERDFTEPVVKFLREAYDLAE